MSGKNADGVPLTIYRPNQSRGRSLSARTNPVIRINLSGAVQYVLRYVWVAAGPEPDLDERVRALHRVETASRSVERRAVAAGRRDLDATPCIVRCGDVAVVPFSVSVRCHSVSRNGRYQGS